MTAEFALSKQNQHSAFRKEISFVFLVTVVNLVTYKSVVRKKCFCCACLSLGGALGRYVQRKLSGEKLFQEPFVSVRESLKAAINICEQWVLDCEHLTGQVFLKHHIYINCHIDGDQNELICITRSGGDTPHTRGRGTNIAHTCFIPLQRD